MKEIINYLFIPIVVYAACYVFDLIAIGWNLWSGVRKAKADKIKPIMIG